MRALFLCVAIWTFALGASAADAESVKPKYPAEIVAASARIAQRNEDWIVSQFEFGRSSRMDREGA
jgi:hypothetical protein